MKSIRYGLLGLFIVLVVSLIFFFAFVNYPEGRDYRNIQIHELEGHTLFLSLELGLYNPNSFSIQNDRLEADISLNQVKVAHLTQQGELIKLPAKDSSFVPVRVALDLHEFHKVYQQLLEEKVNVGIDGSLRLHSAIGKYSLPFRRSEEVNLRTQPGGVEALDVSTPSFRIRNSQAQAGLVNTVVDFQAVLDNPYPFSFTIEKADARLLYGEKESRIADWNLKDPLPIQAQARQTFPVHLEVSNANLLFAGISSQSNMNLLMRGKAHVRLADRVFVLPIHHRFRALPALLGR